MPNPILPLNEYVPDVEAHVFGNRVYLYGSHDAANCCGLKTPKPIQLGVGKQQSLPRITEKEGKLILADLIAGCQIGYRYLDLTECRGIKLEIKGDATVCVNGKEPDPSGIYYVEQKNHATVTLEVVTGHCDIETIEFIE